MDTFYKFVRKLWTLHLDFTICKCVMVHLTGGMMIMAFEVHEVDLHDIDAVMSALDKASEQAEANGKIMTQLRLGCVLGLNKQVMSEILYGHTVKYKGKNIATNVIELMKKSAEYSELCVSDAGFAARNPAMAIFVLKAVHGYDDHPQSGANNNINITFNDKDIPD
jgi:hypothetical protein